MVSLRRFWPLLLITLFACKFTYSPFEVGTVKLRQNSTNLQKIRDTESATAVNYKVAFIADTHNYYEDLDDLVETINAAGPYAFVIVVGDVTNFGLLEEYKKTKDYLDQLNFPYLVVVGNHDLLSSGEKVFNNLFGKSDFSFTFKDSEFILFNNNNWESGGAVPNKLFVESNLLASASPHKILVAHVSPRDRDRNEQPEIQVWEQLMIDYDVDYFIHGHNHNPGEASFGPGMEVTVGAPSKRVYLELIFNGGGVTHQKISY